MFVVSIWWRVRWRGCEPLILLVMYIVCTRDECTQIFNTIVMYIIRTSNECNTNANPMRWIYSFVCRWWYNTFVVSFWRHSGWRGYKTTCPVCRLQCIHHWMHWDWMCTRYECYQCVTTLSCVSTAQSDACDTMHTQCIGHTHIVCRGDTTHCVVLLWGQ